MKAKSFKKFFVSIALSSYTLNRSNGFCSNGAAYAGRADC